VKTQGTVDACIAIDVNDVDSDAGEVFGRAGTLQMDCKRTTGRHHRPSNAETPEDFARS
jgi:hypothetical protein